MFSDEPKVKFMDTMPKTVNFDPETIGHKRSLLESVRTEIVK